VHLNSFPGPVSWEYRWCQTEWIEFRSRPFASSWCSWTIVVFMSCVVLCCVVEPFVVFKYRTWDVSSTRQMLSAFYVQIVLWVENP
jgi:hypothetical protein